MKELEPMASIELIHVGDDGTKNIGSIDLNTKGQKTVKPKLSTVEKRAQEYCSNLKEHNGGRIVIEWKKSRTWGSNPHIENWSGENCVSVSGCGYCKESTALADFLAFLFEKGTQEHDSIRRTGGAGVSSVMEALKKAGWTLEKIAGTQTADVFDLKKN